MSEDDPAPTIGARDLKLETPWVRVIDKEIIAPDGARERYLAVEVSDYIAICPQLPDHRFLMVRQFRPPLEASVWEFPSGQLEPDETAAAAADRELFEETGHRVRRLVALGIYHADPGRLTNRGHLFFGAVAPADGWQPEPGITVARFSAAEIDAMIADGRFTHLQHIALWLMVKTARLADE
jgi:ADP-ribose pyrophosphatase